MHGFLKNSDAVRWGMIGCGRVAETKSAPAFNRVGRSRLVSVASRTPGRAADYARRHGLPQHHASVQALIEDDAIDAIYIATTPDAHNPLAVQCAQAGKAVYLEKPMGLNYPDFLQTCQLFERLGLPLYVAFYRRALERFVRLRALLMQDKLIGDIRHIQYTLYRPVESDYQNPARLPWAVRPEISGGGLFVDLGCHALDIFDFMFGPIRQVQGHALNQAGAYPAEDAVAAAFVFESSMHGVALWNFSSFERRDTFEIVGTRGKAVGAVFGDSDIQFFNSTGCFKTLSAQNPVHIQQPLIATVVADLLGTGRCESTGASALRTKHVMHHLLHLP